MLLVVFVLFFGLLKTISLTSLEREREIMIIIQENSKNDDIHTHFFVITFLLKSHGIPRHGMANRYLIVKEKQNINYIGFVTMILCFISGKQHNRTRN